MTREKIKIIKIGEKCGMNKVKCPECGCDIGENAIKCPFCDYIIKSENMLSVNTHNYLKNKNSGIGRKVSGIIFIIASIVLFACSFSRINNSEYKFYKEHYETCLSEYDDNKSSARLEGLLFTSTYNMIADRYKDMAFEDKEKLNQFKLQASILGVLGVVLLVSGLVFMCKKRSN